MAEREIGFGVLGLGMGRAHCRDIQDAQGACLVAVCDLDEERLKKAQEDFGVRGYIRFEDLLADEEVEVVNIVTPSGTHAQLTIQALRAGKHVICEKPPDVTVEKVDEMIAVQRETGRKLQIVFQSRFSPLFRKVKEAVDKGRLGPLVGIHGTVHWYRTQAYYDAGGWKGTWALDGGGSLMNQGVHTVDLMQWIGGPVESVYGHYGVFGHQIEAEDKTVAVLKFRNGALGTIVTTTCAYPGLHTELMVHGTRGSIVVVDDKLVTWRVQQDDQEAEKAEEQQMLATYGPQEKQDVSVASDPFAHAWRGHLAQVEDMVQAIREDRKPFITAENTRHTVEIVTAIYKSHRRGAPVVLGS
ncbi:MAG TPA: Gfo/Idh/MocA family oxidoreductase [Armatimonadetes bacterium]|nr:Gfo/Idh/MocA family oxidoreductase [Armatimonadota bacterium]